MSSAPYPWQAQVWRRLTADLANLPHALLLAGIDGLGKVDLALQFAQLLLCHAPKQAATEPCAACSACHLVAASTHPDLLVFRDEPRILLPDIHRLRQFLQLTAHLGGAKIAVLARAETMNLAAANALLKILEEPPPRKFILLTTANLGLMPATVRSRCITVPLHAPPTADLMKWLRHQKVAQPDSFLVQYGRSAPLYIRDLLVSGRGEILRRINDHLDRLEKGKISWRQLATECQVVAGKKDVNIHALLDLFIWRLENLALNRSSSANAPLHTLHRVLLARRRLILGGINLSQELLYAECALLWQRAFTPRAARTH